MKWVSWDNQSLRLQIDVYRRYAGDISVTF
jgi:hypothetical protein